MAIRDDCDEKFREVMQRILGRSVDVAVAYWRLSRLVTGGVDESLGVVLRLVVFWRRDAC